jgi:hypothetical protein
MPARNARGTNAFESLPVGTHKTLMRLASALAGNNMVLPPEILDEISAISIEGADPHWQIEQMEKILDRWVPTH